MFGARKPIMRKQSGALGYLMVCAIVPMTFLVGSMAVDFAHMTAVRSELQNATDAAALAGAQSLITDPTNVETHAREICGVNLADGRSVSSDSANTDVSVDVTPAVGTNPGACQVTAQMTINHLFAPIFGRQTEDIVVTSIAATQGSLKRTTDGGGFPLAIGTGTGGNESNGQGGPQTYSQPSILDRNVGDLVELNLNAQGYKNVAFTSLSTDPASGNTIHDMIDQALGITPVTPGTIPPVEVGDSIALNNGVIGAHQLASSPYYEAMMNMPLVILPVVEGDPAFNQTRTVVGFITVRFESVTLNQSQGQVETIMARIVKSIVPGLGDSDVPDSTNDSFDPNLAGISPGPVRLVHSLDSYM